MKIIISDLGGVLLFPKDKSIQGKLNPIFAVESQKSGFNFFDHFELNKELLDYYSTLKEKGVVFYMITEGIIQNDATIKTQLEAVFTKIFSSGELGQSKKEPGLYLDIAKELNIPTSDVLYIDDSVENANAATEAGYKVITYENNQQLISKCEAIGVNIDSEGTPPVIGSLK